MGETEVAFAFALRALARRDHAAAELERKLRGKVSVDVAASVMTRLRDLGYVDDRRFARRWVEGAVHNGRYYGVRLRLELARRGIERDLIDEVLAETDVGYDGEEAARGVLARKFPTFDPRTAPDRDKRRVMGYLQRKGFALSVIMHCFRTAGRTDDDI